MVALAHHDVMTGPCKPVILKKEYIHRGLPGGSSAGFVLLDVQSAPDYRPRFVINCDVDGGVIGFFCYLEVEEALADWYKIHELPVEQRANYLFSYGRAVQREWLSEVWPWFAPPKPRGHVSDDLL